MSRFRDNTFTIFDMLAKKGLFRSNPANADSYDENGSLYRGPVAYPKMLYHPKGETRVVEPAHMEPSPLGPVQIHERRELINVIVANAEEERQLREAGWHDHPADAMRAGGHAAPEMSPAERVTRLEAELATLRAEKARTAPAPEAAPAVAGSLAQRLAAAGAS